MTIINIEKIRTVKVNREDASFVDIKLYFGHKNEGFLSITRSLDGEDSSFKQAAV